MKYKQNITKYSKKNQRQTNKQTKEWNMLGDTKPLLTTSQWLLCPFCLILANDTISPKRSHSILMILTDSHMELHAEIIFFALQHSRQMFLIPSH